MPPPPAATTGPGGDPVARGAPTDSAGGARRLVLEAAEGDLLIGVDATAVQRRWSMVGLARAEVRPVAVAGIVAEAAADSAARAGLERWLARTDPAPPPVAELLGAVDPAAALRVHGRRAAAAEAAEDRRRRLADAARIDASEAEVASATDRAVDALASVFDWRRFLESRLVERQDELLDACRLVGDRIGVTIHPPTAEDLLRSDPLTAIARASKVRFRRVALTPDWWRQEGEPLVGELAGGGHVALLPRRRRGYHLIDPGSGRSTVVAADVADLVRPTAIAMVRPLPGAGTSPAGLLRFAARGARLDIAAILALATVVGLLALVAPLATRVVFGQIVPQGDDARLIPLIVGLVAVALAAALFEIARGVALVRARVRTSNALQSALWDRMLRLPASFFRRYQVGDLAERSMAVSALSDMVTDAVVVALLSGVFGLFNLVAMIIISPPLAMFGLALCLVGAVGMFVSRRLGSGPWREMLDGSRQVAAEVLQYVTGIVKIRTSGAERRVFSRWAHHYAQQNVRALRTFRIDNLRVVFQGSFWTCALLALFVAIYFVGRAAIPPADFMAFYVAFGQLTYAFFQFSGSFVTVLEAAPILEQSRPILDTATESDEPKQHPGTLTGGIEVRHVRFRYPGAPENLFEDLSLSIAPGEFVAVVGPSGSGKSSLLRLLLGFDVPDSGSILYDHKDLSTLDIDAVRQQLGVVLQKTDLLPGSIYQNIAGSAELTEEEVWDAARSAALDGDIARLPDGMDTEIGEGVGILSGGQRQRLQIARAIASRPRLLFLDEATSALDNITQSVVSRTVSGMPITRVVIAHRLSTIAAADRVVVIAGGRVVQDGPFDELAGSPGPFADLIARQLL